MNTEDPNQNLLASIKEMLDDALAPIKADVQSLKADVQSLKADVQSLKADVEILKTDMYTVKLAQQQLDTKIDTTTQQLNAKIDTTTQQLNAKIDTTTQQLNAKIEGVREDLKDRTLLVLAAVKDVRDPLVAFKAETRTSFQKLDRRLNQSEAKMAVTVTRVDELEDRFYEIEALLTKDSEEIHQKFKELSE